MYSMSRIDYYVHCKNHCTQLIHKLDREIGIHNLMHLSKKRNELVELRQKYDRKIKTFCKHEFVQDLIDIDPDRSETIEYCHKCEYTKQKN